MGVTENQSHSVLVLEDDTVLASALREFLEEEGWAVECATTARQARSMISNNVFDLVLADYRLPDADALTVFDDIQSRSPLTKVMMMTGVVNGEVAASAFRRGASDLIYKPFEISELEARIEKLMEATGVGLEEVAPKDEAAIVPETEIVGESPPMKRLFQMVDLVARTKATVMILGESGTGKELVARELHRASARRNKPFIAINCGAIPEHLLEDELFGHVKGAYTDASQPRAGKFEQAHGGTLFLDEIGNMPLPLQVKLLRVLEQRELERLGSNQVVRVNVRIIAATNCDLKERTRNGDFREDLYYRLNVVPIHLPPLRRRISDVPLLINHFLEIFAEEYELPQKQLHPDALKKLLLYSWPGNVRELRNAVEFATVLSGERKALQFEDFPALVNELESAPNPLLHHVALPEEGINLNEVIAELERHLIEQSLERTGGNKGKAARLLHLKRTTLVEKLRRMNRLEECA